MTGWQPIATVPRKNEKPVLLWQPKGVLQDEGCWFWQGTSEPRGYGRFWPLGVQRGGWVLAHRFAWELAHGVSARGLVIRHSCDTPNCVNHQHLIAGTNADNMRDKVMRNRQYRPIGELNGMALLSDAIVRQIKANVTATTKELAAKFGVSPSAIYDIRRGLRWAHV